MKLIPVYIASHFPNREMILTILKATKNFNLPIEITSTWLKKERAVSFHHDVGTDFRDIDKSQVVVVITPWYKGSMCETAYALGQNKPTIVLLDPLVCPDLEKLPPELYSEYFPLVKFEPWLKVYDKFDLRLYKFIIAYSMLELESCLRKIVTMMGGVKEE